MPFVIESSQLLNFSHNRVIFKSELSSCLEERKRIKKRWSSYRNVVKTQLIMCAELIPSKWHVLGVVTALFLRQDQVKMCQLLQILFHWMLSNSFSQCYVPHNAIICTWARHQNSITILHLQGKASAHLQGDFSASIVTEHNYLWEEP